MSTDQLDGQDEFDPFSGCVECSDENLDVQLTAPPEHEWYHGRLHRDLAEDRLRGCPHPGAYLIRESERKPGTFVLSFLGSSDISHFRIVPLCGDYYVGGRQFSSLSDLIGYYSSVSDLLKGERLRYPLPPSQPVEPIGSQKRVVAILPYTKMPDTDELSFHKGDIFVVHNEIGDGWLWVTCVKSQESGLIYQALVEELKPPGDPNERYLWFHPNISKQKAADRLVQGGSGSYLVRPSDSQAGDYVLYFYLGNKIPIYRFKIENLGPAQLQMGGRNFNSLEAIIDRYKTEQIVEGHTLVSPVLRDAFEEVCGLFKQQTITRKSESDTKEIYEAIQRHTGYHMLTSCTSGYLYLKHEKTKKWKQQYFILNANDQQLFIFENEKRTKPKGLIDLSYCFLYPVHDSLFDRPNCFQLVVRALSHSSTHYMCADTIDDCMAWFHALRPLCAQSQRQKKTSATSLPSSKLKELRSLELHVLDAKKLPSKLMTSAYAVISLNDVKICRSRVKPTPNPIFDEKFFLDDIPSDVSSFTVTLFSKNRRSKDSGVAQVTLDLQHLEGGHYLDEWYPLNPPLYSDLKLPPDLGAIRLRARYLHEIIMPLERYEGIKELLLDSEVEVINLLALTCGSDRCHLAQALLRLFRSERIETRMLPVINHRDIITHDENTSTLFRGTSLATTLMDQYMRQTAEYFVHQALGDYVAKIVESKQSCEINPDLLDKHQNIATNISHFLSLLEDLVNNIFKSVDHCPLPLRYIYSCLQRSVSVRWPEDRLARTRVVSGFIFLRLLCPALLNPRHFNLIAEDVSSTSTRALTLSAKALINLANLAEAKESFMEVINPFIKSNREKMIVFLDELSNVHMCPVPIEVGTCEPARDLATLHQICVTHYQDLQLQAQQHQQHQPIVKKLLAVTDVLSTQRANYMNERANQNKLLMQSFPGRSGVTQPHHVISTTSL